jgi:serine/threonine protein kinase
LDELQDGDPRQVGKYTLLGRLGSGGMGQVFLGRSIGGRQVAVKVIRADLARDRNFRARFAREVEAASRVSGAFTAPVIDADPDAVIPWLVTSYVRGPSLADAVEEHGPLPLSSVLTLAAGLAEGLAAVHEAGVIHRDLKPSNVLLAADGPRLIDFGISQAADFSQVTVAGMVIGTPGFMSPEQAVGDPVGPASDIFGLGAVLAFAATGEGPYGTGSPAVRQQRVLFSAPRLDNLPAALRPIVARCMSASPAARPTANQFLAELVAAHPSAADQTDWLPAGILPAGSAGPPAPTRPGARAAAKTTPPPVTPSAWEPPAPDPLAATVRDKPARTPGWEPTLTSTPHRETPPPETPHPEAAASPLTQPPDPRPQPVREPPAWQEPAPTWRGQAARPAWQGPPPGPPPGPPSVPAPTVPAPPAGNRRRRRWAVAAVALAAAVGAVIGVVAALPRAAPPLLRPTGLVTSASTSQSVRIAWSGPASGPLPDRYEVQRNGHDLASVPGNTTGYRATGLAPDTAYRFRVIAIRGGKRSSPSSVLIATTPTPPLYDAVLNSSGLANLTETAGNFTETYNSQFAKRDVGDTWQESWSFVPGCASGPCAVQVSGSVTGPQFSAELSRNGATYSGSVAIDNWWYCGSNINNRMDTTLNIQVTGVHAKMINGVWSVTSFTGTLVWNVEHDSDGNCPAATYKMRLSGT